LCPLKNKKIEDKSRKVSGSDSKDLEDFEQAAKKHILPETNKRSTKKQKIKDIEKIEDKSSTKQDEIEKMVKKSVARKKG